MITNEKWLLIAFLLASVVILIIGYAMTNLWLVILVLPVILLAGWLTRQSSPGWLPSVLLALYTVEAAGGALVGAIPGLMIAGAAFMLISWEISAQLRALKGAANHPQGRLSSHAHIRRLITAVGIGLLIAEAGLLIHLRVPFGIILLAGLLVLFSLYRFYRLLQIQ